MKKLDQEFENNVRRILNQSLEDLDSFTLAKVSRLKYQAMDLAMRKKARRPVWILVPALASLLLIVLLGIPNDGDRSSAPADLAELSLLTGSRPLEFYAEDAEFYEWCEEIMESEVDQPGRGTVVPDNINNQPADSRGEIGYTGGSGDKNDPDGGIARLGNDQIFRYFRG